MLVDGFHVKYTPEEVCGAIKLYWGLTVTPEAITELEATDTAIAAALAKKRDGGSSGSSGGAAAPWKPWKEARAASAGWFGIAYISTTWSVNDSFFKILFNLVNIKIYSATLFARSDQGQHHHSIYERWRCIGALARIICRWTTTHASRLQTVLLHTVFYQLASALHIAYIYIYIYIYLLHSGVYHIFIVWPLLFHSPFFSFSRCS